MSIDTRGYSTREAAELAGISYRMLDYWIRSGIVKLDRRTAPGSGNWRRLSEGEVEALIEVATLHRSAQAILRDFSSGLLWDIARGKETLHERRGA